MERGLGERIDFEQAADRFRVIGQFLQEMGKPDSLHRLVDVLQERDSDAFHRMIEGVPEFPEKCSTLHVIVRDVLDDKTAMVEVERCALRLDLTPTERLLAGRIYRKHFATGVPTQVVVTSGTLQSVVLEVIEPGPYLDELRANGLVYCWKEDVSVFVFALGPPRGQRGLVRAKALTLHWDSPTWVRVRVAGWSMG